MVNRRQPFSTVDGAAPEPEGLAAVRSRSYATSWLVTFVFRGSDARRPLRARSGCGLHAGIDGVPANIGKKCLDVLRALRGLVVEKKCVLPNIHHQ